MKNKIKKYSIYAAFIIGLIFCIALLFPQVRRLFIDLIAQILLKDPERFLQLWFKQMLNYAMGGIFLIVVFGYCSLTNKGKILVHEINNGIRDCLKGINWRSFTKPVFLMFSIYLFGIISIIRANFYFLDDIGRSVDGFRGWIGFSRYLSEFLSVFINADFRLADISPLPQLIAIFILAISSVLLVYILNDGIITNAGLLASVPIGLSPYMLECLSFKFDAPYMALSVLASIVPFLFIARKKTFVFVSVISLLVMCMTYQASSGIYLLITLVLSFNNWNEKRKTKREILIFLGMVTLSFLSTMVIFKLFLIIPQNDLISTAIFPVSQLFSGVLANINNYYNIINNDFGLIWKAIIGIIFCFYITKTVYTSVQNKFISFTTAIILLCLLFVLSEGIFVLLEHPLMAPRALYGFGMLLGIINISIAVNFNKSAKISAWALSWCFLVFALSYGNALADQKRYANFRATILLQDLNDLFPPDKVENKIAVELKNTIGFTPVVKNIGIHNPVIYRIVPLMITEEGFFNNLYYNVFFNFSPFANPNITNSMLDGKPYVDFSTLNLPIVKKTYYHTIRSDGKRVLVELNEGIK